MDCHINNRSACLHDIMLVHVKYIGIMHLIQYRPRDSLMYAVIIMSTMLRNCSRSKYCITTIQGLFQDFAPGGGGGGGGKCLVPKYQGGKWNESAQCVRKHAHLGGSGGMLPQENF